MNKVRSTVKHMPRKAKLLTALLACMLVITLIGVAVVAAAEKEINPDQTQEITIGDTKLELSRPEPRADWDNSYPAYTTINGYAYEKWTCENDTVAGLVYGIFQSNSMTFEKNTGVLKITNKSAQKISLKLDYTARTTGSGCSFFIRENGNDWPGSVNAEKSVTGSWTTKTILPEGSVEIWLTIDKDEKTGADPVTHQADLVINKITVEKVAGKTLGLLAPEAGGSYSAIKKDKDGVDVPGSEVKVTSASTNARIEYDPAAYETVQLTADSNPDYNFYLWVDGNGNILSTEKSITVDDSSIAADSICPVFVSEGELGAPAYRIPNGKLAGDYYYWDDAMNAAGINFDKNVVLLQPLSLENVKIRNSADTAKTFTIPNGVTLVVPYSDKLSTGKEDAVNTSDGTAAKQYGVEKDYNGTSVAFRTLTVPGNYTLNVNGTLLVNAVQGGKNGVSYQSHIVGTYGQMIVGGTVNVNSGGELYARGYITDLNHITDNHIGKINVNDGGSLIQMMQITDHRGGDYTAAVYQQLMPITMYYLENNMVDTTYQYGSTMRAQVVLAAGQQAVSADVRVIANGADKETPCMFVMDQDTAISTKYNYAEDKLHVTLDSGKVTMNFLQIDHPIMSINTAKNVLAISDNMPITVAAGATLETNYDLKFLPGAELTVNGTLNINKGSDLYFYGATDYQADWSYGQFRTHIQPVGDIVKIDKNTPGDDDAKLILKGTLTLSGTLSQSNNHSGLLADAGKGAEIIINQLQYDGKSVNESLSGGYPLPKPPASGITYVKAGDYYYAINKGWKAPLGHMGENPETLAGLKNTGTYKRDPNNKFWYQFALTVKYDGITHHKEETRYVSKSSTVLNAPKNTVITAIPDVDVQNFRTVQSANYNNALADGWKQVQLLNLNADKTITLTCKDYNHTVTWKEFYGANTTQANNTVVSYVSSTDTGVSQAFGGAVSKVVKSDGTAMNKGTDYTLSEDGKTVTLKNAVSENMVLHVTTGNATPTVTWNVMGPDGQPVVVAQTTASGGEASYTVEQPTDTWWVIEQGNYSASDSNVKTEVSQDKRTLTLSGITGPVTVTVKLTEYKHCINGTVQYEEVTIGKGSWGNITQYNLASKTSSTQNEYTNDDEYRWTIPGNGEKNLLTAITSISGCAIGEADKADSALRQEIGNTLTMQLTGKDVSLNVSTRNYIAKMTWNVSKADEGTDDGSYGYVEYYTGKFEKEVPGEWQSIKYYETLLSNGTTGSYYYDREEFHTAYTVPESAGKFMVQYASEGVENIPRDDGKTGWMDRQWAIPDQPMNRTFECTAMDQSMDDEFNSAGCLYGSVADSTATLVLKPYDYSVKFMDASNRNDPLAEYCVTKETASVEYKSDDTKWDDWCATAFTIKGGKDAKVNGLEAAKDGDVIITFDKGYTLTGITQDTTVTLTLKDTSKVFNKYIDWTINDIKNANNYKYTEYCLVDGKSFINPFEKVCATTNNHVWDGNKVTYTLPDGYEDCYIKENRDKKTDRRSKDVTVRDGADQKITIQPYAKRAVAYINGVPSEYYYFDTMEAKPSMQFIHCGDGITVSRCIAKGCEVTNLNAKDPTNMNVRLDDVFAADARVDIWTEPTGTDVTTSAAYYMGDMSFEYVRNAAAFTWDGKEGTTGSWKPVNSFGWRHAVGSKSYEVGGKTLTVDNGSILFVNTMQNTPVTYTVQLSKTGDTDYGVSLMFDESDKAIKVNDDGSATVTVKPNSRVTLVCRMTGTPNFNGGSEIEIGTITVKKN